MRLAKEITFLVGALVWYAGALFYHSDIPREKIIQKYNIKPSAVVISGDTVYFTESGKGPAILLLHGTSSFYQTWDGWTDTLEKHYRVIRMDLPGFGLTGRPSDGDYSVEKYTSTLVQLSEHLGLDSFHIAGNSFGGYLALEMALRHPEKIISTTVLNSSGYDLPEVKKKWSGFALAKTPVIRSIMRYVTPKFAVSESLKSFYGDKNQISSARIDRYFDYLLCGENRRALIEKSNWNYAPLNDRMGGLKPPLLILWGGRDSLIPVEHGHALHRATSRSEFHVFEHLGHLPMEESPKKSVSIYLNFLKHWKKPQ